MPTSPRETVLCRYRYDPLDRSIEWVPDKQAGIQRFYCKTRLATEIQDSTKLSIFQHDDQLLAQLRREDEKVDTLLLATDQQRSILNALDANQPHPFAYTPYGHRSPANGRPSLLGFNGEQPDSVTGHYHLGNGYRQFNPMLMRFNSPDSLSPFGEGGVNAYAYCQGNPVNRDDPTGHWVRPVTKGLTSVTMIGVGTLLAIIAKKGEGADEGDVALMLGGVVLAIAGLAVGVNAVSRRSNWQRMSPRERLALRRQRVLEQQAMSFSNVHTSTRPSLVPSGSSSVEFTPDRSQQAANALNPSRVDRFTPAHSYELSPRSRPMNPSQSISEAPPPSYDSVVNNIRQQP